MSEKHTLTQEERHDLAIALNYHEHCDKVTIEFSNDNGIGEATIVRCLDCKTQINVTDYSVW